MLTANAIEGYKHYTERTIGYARYRLGTTWYTAPIDRKERMPDGRVAVYFSVIPQASSSVVITAVQLYDKADKLWAEKTENINIRSVQDGVLYRFTFDLHEQEV